MLSSIVYVIVIKCLYYWSFFTKVKAYKVTKGDVNKETNILFIDTCDTETALINDF